MFGKTRVFGIAVALYALISTGLICWDPDARTLDLNANGFIVAGGLLMLAAGSVISVKKDFDKMKAIALYAMTFAVYKALRAYSVLAADPGHKLQFADVVALFTVMASVMLFILGLSFFLGTAKSIRSKVFVSMFYIVINTFTLLKSLVCGEMQIAAAMAVEMLVLAMFIRLLISKDVRINTVSGKRRQAKRATKADMRAAKDDYARAMAEAKALRKAGDPDGAAKAESDARRDFERRVAEIGERRREAENKRYRCDPETGEVEAIDDGGNGKGSR